MSKCPYCDNEIHLHDFFYITTKETKKGKTKQRIEGFKGEEIEQSLPGFGKQVSRNWACPSCNKTLSITEFAYKWD